jgi:hypothetical protein
MSSRYNLGPAVHITYLIRKYSNSTRAKKSIDYIKNKERIPKINRGKYP